MRHIRKVGMWPVGLISKYGVSSPIVANGTISGFYDGWIGGRKYPIDMAGFAVSVKFLLSRPKAEMPFKAGYEEDGFLRSLDPLDMKEIDLLASNCTEVGADGVTLKIKSLQTADFILDSHVAHAVQEKPGGTSAEPDQVRRDKLGEADEDSCLKQDEQTKVNAIVNKMMP